MRSIVVTALLLLALLTAATACQTSQVSEAPSASPEASSLASTAEASEALTDVALGEPVVFSEGGAASVGVIVENVSAEDLTVTLEPVAAGEAVAQARTIVLAAGERRAVEFATDEAPSAEGLAVQASAIDPAEGTPDMEAASSIVFGKPRALTDDSGLRQIVVDVTNDGDAPVDVRVGGALLSGDEIAALGHGDLENLQPGATESVQLLMFGDTTNLSDPLLYVDAITVR